MLSNAWYEEQFEEEVAEDDPIALWFEAMLLAREAGPDTLDEGDNDNDPE